MISPEEGYIMECVNPGGGCRLCGENHDVYFAPGFQESGESGGEGYRLGEVDRMEAYAFGVCHLLTRGIVRVEDRNFASGVKKSTGNCGEYA